MERVEAELRLDMVRDRRRQGEDGRPLVRGARRGEFLRVRRGVYVDAEAWSGSSWEERARARIRSVQGTRRSIRPVFSHESAAILWGIPLIGGVGLVHAYAPGHPHARSRRGVVWHHDPLDETEVQEVEGILVTGFVRTLLDLARTVSFPSAVAALDFGSADELETRTGTVVAGVSRPRLLELVTGLGPLPGVRKALAAARFSDARAESPGESLSRVQMHLLRLPRPGLQSEFERLDDRGTDRVDFEWAGVLGEFDGHAKYTRARYTQGRDMAEIVWEEKQRQDRLRALTGKSVARWLWADAREPERMRRLLAARGLTPLSEARYRREFPRSARVGLRS